jgi:uncharacterized delta-60 repeat protein
MLVKQLFFFMKLLITRFLWAIIGVMMSLSCAQAQVPTVTTSALGSTTLCPGGSVTLQANAQFLNAGFGGRVFVVQAQPDGKLLVGGDFSTYNGEAVPHNLVRLNADYTLDRSFNAGGEGFGGPVYALLVQADGNLVVGGELATYNGSQVYYLARLTPVGRLDASFNATQRVRDVVLALALQADGGILVGGGYYYDRILGNAILLKLNSSGVTSGFTAGISRFGGIERVTAIAVQPDGRILLGGDIINSSNPSRPLAKAGLVRLLSNGQDDGSFNANGSGFSPGDIISTIVLQPDGRLLVGGSFTTYNGDTNTPDGLIRLTATGELDTSFAYGRLGFVEGSISTISIQPGDGSVVVGGYFTTYGGNASAPANVLRLLRNGELDPSFNLKGAGTNSLVNAVLLLPAGQVLIGGEFTRYNSSASIPTGLVQLTTEGQLDYAPPSISYRWNTGATGARLVVSQPGRYQATATSPAGMGYSNVLQINAPPAVDVRISPAGPVQLSDPTGVLLTATATMPGFDALATKLGGTVRALIAQPDGSLLVGGSPWGIARVTASGQLDATFASSQTGVGGQVNALCVQPDGKILVGGAALTYQGVALPATLMRLYADGTRDQTFLANTPPGAGITEATLALALQSDGRVLVGGTFTAFGGNASAPANLVRLNPNGSLDQTFNPSGQGANAPVQALAVQPNGLILVGGQATAYNGQAASPDYIFRLQPDGTLDAGFNATFMGSQVLGTDAPVMAIALQADDQIVLGGSFTRYNGRPTSARVLRLHADGSFDSSFNSGQQGANAPVRAVAVQPNGHLLLGGDFTSYNGQPNVPARLLRLTADGALDTSFNPGGAGAAATVYTIATLPDAKILVGGAVGAYNGVPLPTGLLRLTVAGLPNQQDVPLAGATFFFAPGPSSGSTRRVTTAGTYSATATDPATGCSYSAQAVVGGAPLPVTLVAFSARIASPTSAQLTWVTASELQSAFFEVERSSDGQIFTRVGQVTAAGTSTAAHTYHWLDAALPPGAVTVYYRLRQLDQDGTATYSPVRPVIWPSTAPTLTLYPNPTSGVATLTGAKSGVAVQVFDALGRLISTSTTDATGKVQLPDGLPTGVYIVRTDSQTIRLVVAQ